MQVFMITSGACMPKSPIGMSTPVCSERYCKTRPLCTGHTAHGPPLPHRLLASGYLTGLCWRL